MEFYYHTIKFKIFLPIIRLLSFFYKNQTKFKTNEFEYIVPIGFDPITKFLMKFNLYEKKERSLLSEMYDNTDIIEAGAGVGLISMYLKKKNKNKRLIMLEPNIKMNPIIKKNFNINNFNDEDVHILNYGLSNEEKKNVPFQKFESDMANTISQETLDYNFKKQNIEEIETISINTIIKKYNLNEFQLVLDIEGEELNVIKNNNGWLNNCKCILLENHLPKKKLDDLNNFIINKGFNLIKKKENVFLFKKFIENMN